MPTQGVAFKELLESLENVLRFVASPYFEPDDGGFRPRGLSHARVGHWRHEVHRSARRQVAGCPGPYRAGGPRGQAEADLPATVRHVHDPAATIPVEAFPKALFEPAPDVVIHMIAMGERDAHAATQAFRGRARRLVALSRGDVYLAYGRFTGLEPGPTVEDPLQESSPLRTVLTPIGGRRSPLMIGLFIRKNIDGADRR